MNSLYKKILVGILLAILAIAVVAFLTLQPKSTDRSYHPTPSSDYTY